MATSVKQLLADANQSVPRITPDEAQKIIGSNDALVVDVRDPSEVTASGKLKGAVNVSRGMLEFRADPESAYYDQNFRKDRTVIVYRASGSRSALAGKALQDLGYSDVRNLGAFKDATEKGLATEQA